MVTTANGRSYARALESQRREQEQERQSKMKVKADAINKKKRRERLVNMVEEDREEKEQQKKDWAKTQVRSSEGRNYISPERIHFVRATLVVVDGNRLSSSGLGWCE